MRRAPMITAQVTQSARTASISGCQAVPGIRFHLSSQGFRSSRISRRASSSTRGLSAEACDRKTSKRAGMAPGPRFDRRSHEGWWGLPRRGLDLGGRS